VNRQASLTSRVRAGPSFGSVPPCPSGRSVLPGRSAVSAAVIGTPVPSIATYSMSGNGVGGSGTRVRVRIASARAVMAAAAARPSVSAVRWTALAFTSRPARSASSRPAGVNGTAAPARSIIRRSPGVSDVPATPSCSSRGAVPCLQTGQWYQARRNATVPSTVRIVLPR